MADISDITKHLSATEVLAQLGEEGAELGQAALKLRRAMDGSNPHTQERERMYGQPCGRICRCDAVRQGCL